LVGSPLSRTGFPLTRFAHAHTSHTGSLCVTCHAFWFLFGFTPRLHACTWFTISLVCGYYPLCTTGSRCLHRTTICLGSHHTFTWTHSPTGLPALGYTTSHHPHHLHHVAPHTAPPHTAHHGYLCTTSFPSATLTSLVWVHHLHLVLPAHLLTAPAGFLTASRFGLHCTFLVWITPARSRLSHGFTPAPHVHPRTRSASHRTCTWICLPPCTFGLPVHTCLHVRCTHGSRTPRSHVSFTFSFTPHGRSHRVLPHLATAFHHLFSPHTARYTWFCVHGLPSRHGLLHSAHHRTHCTPAHWFGSRFTPPGSPGFTTFALSGSRSAVLPHHTTVLPPFTCPLPRHYTAVPAVGSTHVHTLYVCYALRFTAHVHTSHVLPHGLPRHTAPTPHHHCTQFTPLLPAPPGSCHTTPRGSHTTGSSPGSLLVGLVYYSSTHLTPHTAWVHVPHPPASGSHTWVLRLSHRCLFTTSLGSPFSFSRHLPRLPAHGLCVYTYVPPGFTQFTCHAQSQFCVLHHLFTRFTSVLTTFRTTFTPGFVWLPLPPPGSLPHTSYVAPPGSRTAWFHNTYTTFSHLGSHTTGFSTPVSHSSSAFSRGPHIFLHRWILHTAGLVARVHLTLYHPCTFLTGFCTFTTFPLTFSHHLLPRILGPPHASTPFAFYTRFYVRSSPFPLTVPLYLFVSFSLRLPFTTVSPAYTVRSPSLHTSATFLVRSATDCT